MQACIHARFSIVHSNFLCYTQLQCSILDTYFLSLINMRQGVLHNQLELFTDRREAIALFNYLRGRENRKEPWPLLPVLTFLAPGGSGKSLLIKYLRDKECSLPDGRAVLPYAYLDFTLPH